MFMNVDLLQGDCLELMKGLDDESVDAVIMDPPYNLLTGHKIETEFSIEEVLKHCFRVLKKGSPLVYFGMQPSLTEWNYLANQMFLYKNEIIWYKRTNSGCMGDISKVFENIMVYNKLKKTRFNDVYRPYSDVKEGLGDFYDFKSLKKFVNMCKNIFTKKWQYEMAREYFESNFENKVVSRNRHKKTNDDYHSVGIDTFRQMNSIKLFLTGIKQQNLVSFITENSKNRGNGNGVKHPTVKPIKLLEYLIELTTDPNQTILDPFMGSGTTGIAAVNLDRNFIGYEIDQDYFEIAKKRIKESQDKKETQLI